MWVDGALLHYIASDNKDYGETGASQPAAPGAVHGSIWVDGEDVHYIDSSGTHRTISKTSLGAKPAPAIQGSMYLEANSPAAPGRDIRWVGGTNYYRWWNGS